MERPNRKDIKAAIDRLKEQATAKTGTFETNGAKLEPKKNSQRIRKQGV